MLRADVSLPQIQSLGEERHSHHFPHAGRPLAQTAAITPLLAVHPVPLLYNRGRHDALRNATVRDFVREQPGKLSVIWKYVVCWICAILILYNLRADVRSKHILNAQVSIRSPCC